MTSEDFKHSIVVTKMAKRLAWIVVIVINIYFVYFSVLRGITRSASWQVDYLLACILQLFVEILVYETVECLWIHFTIPQLVSEDVATTMITVKHAINSAFARVKVPAVLDSPKYFFVSRHLAEEFPNLFESSVVLAFQSYFPPGDLDTTTTATARDDDDDDEHEHATDHSEETDTNSWGLTYQDVRVRRKGKKSILMAFLQRFNFSVLLMATLQHLGTVPIRFQQLIIHTLQPILFSFIIIFYFFLVKYPLVALFPMAFLLYEAIMYANRSENGFANKSIPAINDAAKNTSSLEAVVADTNERSRRESGVFRTADERKDGDADAGDDNDDGGDEKDDEMDDGGESTIGRDFPDAPRGERSGRSDSDSDNDSDSDSEGSDSDEYHERNIEKLMEKYAPCRENLDEASENDDDDYGGDDNGGECDSDSDSDNDVDNEEEEQDKFDTTAAAAPLSTTEKRFIHLQQEVYEADDAVKHMCVRIGRNEPEDFDFYWEETSDEFRYLYQHPITPFVNSHGEQVDRDEMVSMRNNVMIKDEVNMKRNTALARMGIERRKQYMLDWDNFRLYDSDLTLPFIDHTGNKVTTSEIEATRSRDIGVSSDASNNIPIVKEFCLLKTRKQTLEHELLVLEEQLQVGSERMYTEDGLD